MNFGEKLDTYTEMLKGIEKDYGWKEAKNQATGLAELYEDYETDEQRAMFVAGLFY